MHIFKYPFSWNEVISRRALASDIALQARFGSVTQAATITCSYCMPEEDGLPVYVARQLKFPMQAIWPQVKHYN